VKVIAFSFLGQPGNTPLW